MNMAGSASADTIMGLKRRTSLVCGSLGLFMIVLAFIPGRLATRDLTWGPYVDFDRDASFAQGVLEGHYGEDPLYKGETMWFTPLMFTFQAYASKITGLEVQVIQARAGAFLNLLVPIGFFLMVWSLFGPIAAVFALFAHLYLIPGSEPGWSVSSYSPWTLPMSFWQGPFYLLMIPLAKGFRTISIERWLLIGAGAGVLFLGHAAPAMIMVLMIAVFVLRRVVGRLWAGYKADAWHHLRAGFAAGAAFIVVTLPLTWYVIGTYMLDQKNRVPAAFTYKALSLRHWDLFVFQNLSWLNVVALVGFTTLLYAARNSARCLVLLWIGVTFAMALFAYAAVTLGVHYGLKLPMSVPAFHFYAYFKGAIAVCFGLAIVRGLSAMNERWPTLMRPARQLLVATSFVLIGVMAVYPAYVHRPDLSSVRQRSLWRMADTDATEMYRLLVKELRWDDVVLCDNELSMWIVMASARKTVATDPSMANPYVPPEPRLKARETMLRGLAQEQANMAGLLDSYEVSHLLVRATDVPKMPELYRWFPRETHRNPSYVLFAR